MSPQVGAVGGCQTILGRANWWLKPNTLNENIMTIYNINFSFFYYFDLYNYCLHYSDYSIAQCPNVILGEKGQCHDSWAFSTRFFQDSNPSDSLIKYADCWSIFTYGSAELSLVASWTPLNQTLCRVSMMTMELKCFCNCSRFFSPVKRRCFFMIPTHLDPKSMG